MASGWMSVALSTCSDMGVNWDRDVRKECGILSKPSVTMQGNTCDWLHTVYNICKKAWLVSGLVCQF